MLAWDADGGDPLTPIVTWQDKRSQEILDELEADGRAELVRERSRLPLDPYFSAGKLGWLLRNDERVAAAVETGTARLGTVDAWLCDMLGAGFATDLSTASRTQLAVPGEPDWDAKLLDVFGVPHAALPPSWTRRASSASCATPTGRGRCRCERRSSISRLRWPAPAASCRGV